MHKLTSQHEERRDVDLRPGGTPAREAVDAHDTTVQQIKEYLTSELKASELDDPRHEHRRALREYADLGRAAEHPYRKLIKAHREAKENA